MLLLLLLIGSLGCRGFNKKKATFYIEVILKYPPPYASDWHNLRCSDL